MNDENCEKFGIIVNASHEISELRTFFKRNNINNKKKRLTYYRHGEILFKYKYTIAQSVLTFEVELCASVVCIQHTHTHTDRVAREYGNKMGHC